MPFFLSTDLVLNGAFGLAMRTHHYWIQIPIDPPVASFSTRNPCILLFPSLLDEIALPLLGRHAG
jgi:hypothetical protein